MDGGGGRDGGGPDAGGIDFDAGDVDANREGTCALDMAPDVGAVYDRTLYVATTGSDTADGSAGMPLATIGAAARMATPGTRILVRAGTYAGGIFLDPLQGEAGRPIKIEGEDGAVLDGTGDGEVMHLSDPRYLVLENLELRGAMVNGLNIDDAGSFDTPAEFVVMRNLYVHDIGTGGNNDCIKLSGVDRFFVLGSEISGCNAGDMIDQVGCHDGLISGNFFHDSPGSGGIQMKGGSSGTLVHGNRFVDVGGRSINAGGSTGLAFFRPIDAAYEAAQLRIIANVFVRSGAMSGAPIAFVGCDACVFANNTVVEPQTWVARILQESTDARFVPSRSGLFVNNVIVFRMADLRTFVNVGPGTAPDTFTFGSNLWFALDTPAFAGPTYTDGIPPETMSVIQVDPMFAGATDYHVSATSPAHAAGRPVPGGLPPDFDAHCYASPPTLGAFGP